MKKNYTEEDMLKVIQEVESEFSQALAKAEAEVKEEEATEDFEQEETELYSSMEKSEAQAHFEALSKVLNVTDIKKSEVKEDVKVDNKESDLIKSEIKTLKESNDELKKSNDELKKNLEQAIAIITKTVKPSAPQRKAIVTEMEYIKKSEEENTTSKDVSSLSKSEISQKLSEQIRSGKLEKKDKDMVLKYYDGHTNLESIKHLL